MARIIGITGGSGSGKTTIVRKISEIVGDFTFIPQDNYYRSAEYVSNTNITAFNFDHPSAFDTDLLVEQLGLLRKGQEIAMPQYDFVRHRRKEETVRVQPGKLVILEGIMLFFEPRIRELIDLKIFVDTPDDIRFIRRLTRDIEERGRTVSSVIDQYLDTVRPGHYEFIEPSKVYADLIVPEGGENRKALEVLVSFMQGILA
ncbi:uridine kinase [Alkalispirochaeta americana]|uniref:Uridine kinase n=1 Tax=Alkalispirochaeta americana TaxID=159291 RepID=A0A1N6V013_9SPIO|nr:uridine kinase [Alkalispirochaeta americana]SIQ70886.1 uridine kinase [Alkalispirochaeta americana]